MRRGITASGWVQPPKLTVQYVTKGAIATVGSAVNITIPPIEKDRHAIILLGAYATQNIVDITVDGVPPQNDIEYYKSNGSYISARSIAIPGTTQKVISLKCETLRFGYLIYVTGGGIPTMVAGSSSESTSIHGVSSESTFFLGYNDSRNNTWYGAAIDTTWQGVAWGTHAITAARPIPETGQVVEAGVGGSASYKCYISAQYAII